ncbi:MAG: DMT family transporter [Oscillospiraceae bacterium]|nr:DMT family transporter [Oscillospiraceae bacterium]
MKHAVKRSTALGVFCVVLSSLCYGISPSVTKLALLAGGAGDTLLFSSFALSALFFGVVMLVTRQSFRVTLSQGLQLAFFGILGCHICGSLMVRSYDYLPVSLTVMFHFFFPAFITIVMAVFFKEKLTVGRIVAIAAALGGIAFLADFSHGVSVKGALLALLSGLAYGSYVIANNKASFVTLPTSVVIFYVSLFTSSSLAGQGLILGTLQLPPNGTVYLYIVLGALVGSIVPLYVYATAVRILGPTTTALLNMLEPVTGVLFGLLLFSEPFSWRTGVGCLLILSCSLLVTLESSRHPAG